MITDELAEHILQTIEQLRGATRIVNEGFAGGGDDGAEDGGDGAPDRSGVRLSREQLLRELADREEKMQSGAEADGVTDQYPRWNVKNATPLRSDATSMVSFGPCRALCGRSPSATIALQLGRNGEIF